MAQQLQRSLAQLIVRVRRYIKQPVESESHWENTFVQQVLNTNYRLRCSELHLAHEGHFHNVAFRDLEANKARYEWPAGFTRLLKLELVRTDGRTVPIQAYERHYESNPSQSSTGDSYSPQYRPLSGGFVLEPQPILTVTEGLRMEFNGIPTELDDDADTLHEDFPEMFDELLVLDTVLALLHSEELQEGGLQRTFATWRGEYEQRFERYIHSRLTRQNRIVPFIISQDA